MEFTTTKKGYSPAEVDKYIEALKREYGATVVKQRDRIAELLEEKKETDRELAGYREKSSQISKAIVNAVAKAEEIERLSRLKYSQEIARLKAFHEKWTAYYAKIMERYPLDDGLVAAGEFNRSMDKILSNALAGGAAPKRKPAAPAAPPEKAPTDALDPMQKIDRYFAEEQPKKTAEAKKETAAAKDYSDRSPSGFSFEEALNPTEDLVDILKDLGMSEDD